MIELPALPFAKHALSPYVSAETLEYHYGKHHQAYVNNLNQLIPGTKYENLPLEDIVRSSDGKVFNNAAQVWNHTFYWNGLSPNASAKPVGALLQHIERQFGPSSSSRNSSPRRPSACSAPAGCGLFRHPKGFWNCGLPATLQPR